MEREDFITYTAAGHAFGIREVPLVQPSQGNGRLRRRNRIQAVESARHRRPSTTGAFKPRARLPPVPVSYFTGYPAF